MTDRCNRRQALKLLGAGLASLWLPGSPLMAASNPLFKKSIPASGEQLPVIGLGTWRTFNVGDDPKLLDARTKVVEAFFQHGGGLIDSSPMYGSAPDVIGYALKKLGKPDSLFSAEKVWSPAGGTAREQVAQLAERWGIQEFDLVQIHNLNDWREHLAALREMKAAGKIRYIGITTSHGRRHREFEQVMASEDIDFAQLTYNITHREVEARLLPLARERGIAVIANRPYDGGNLIKGLKRREKVPEWSTEECGCRTWADFLLKFIVSHPAVHCAIPATTKVEHLNENMRAGHTPMPSADCRQRMARYIESL
ncbi:aldo/keto reductase [Microbulbifer flavimaris]|uniref:Aldo/keto reductase n=1 Tax=Microbulbifer flavimaris TaxID=1781068 RepID=A0ABX4HX85_9GAMM|nr:MULTISPECIES: aldo/keto reductase [Microbulbifer]KUJ80273.1 aldo/keto reductase [Microbulbifer sp. ZGT114]PCO04337.1 aldo/keto reductase [Microbulbifer flavimaris]